MGTEKALIFGAVPCGSWDFLAPLHEQAPLVVCADGGLRLAREAGFSPDFYIGDNDSGGSPEAGMGGQVLPVEKDLTDLQAAYAFCLRRGIRDMTFTACTGGRQDHHLANLYLLEQAWDAGVTARILDDENEITFLPPGTHTFRCGGFHYFGLLPLDRVLPDVSIENAKYPLSHRTVARGDSLTVSNEPLDGPVRVRLGGCALLVKSQRI